MRWIVFILLFIFCSVSAKDSPVELIEVSWSVGSSSKTPESFTKLNLQDTIPLKTAYWLQVKVFSQRHASYILEAGNKYMQGMKYFNQNGDFLFGGNYQEIELQKGGNTLYIYYPFKDFKSTTSYQIRFHNKAEYYERKSRTNTTSAIFLSVMLFLFFLSFSFYLVSKFSEIIYLFYAWYLASIVVFFAYQYGILGSFWANVNTISPAYIWISSASLTISYLFFAQAFLNLKQTDKRVYNLLDFGKYFVLSVMIVELVTYFFGIDIQHSIIYKSIVLLVQATTMPYILYRCYLQKTTLSWIFISGALILVITTLLGQSVSTFKAVDNTNLFIQAGLLIEVFIFSIGIAMRMVLMNKEKRIAQYKLIDQLNLNEQIQKNFIEELETKVDERTKELVKRNKEKEILVREIHHRVKNNLQTVSSLLNIQQRKLQDPAAISAIEDSKNRVKVMGLLHNFLYQQEDIEQIPIKPYLEQLINLLVVSHKGQHEILSQADICSLETSIDQAINIGLVVNELVINSLKYAEPKDGVLSLVIIVTQNQNSISIKVSDNGQKPVVQPPEQNPGFGWKLIYSLVEKLNGEVSSKYSNGLIVDISVPIQKLQLVKT